MHGYVIDGARATTVRCCSEVMTRKVIYIIAWLRVLLHYIRSERTSGYNHRPDKANRLMQ